MPTVTMEIAEYEALRRKVETLQGEINALGDLMRANAVLALEPLQRRLLEGLAAGREVARFAVANLDPETVRGWPWEALDTLSCVVAAAPDADIWATELAAEFHRFAAEAKRLERDRAAGLHKAREASPR